DFSAKDPDGDSLTYSLVTPYNGFSTSDVPSPGSPNPITGRGTFYPGPYPDVSWASGYAANVAIPGSQPLRIDPRTGRLSVTANRVGLFVFSVLVEERRNGRVIGRVRRDFQLQVIDCPANTPPVVLLRSAGQAAFYREGTVLTINENEQNCLTVFLTDREVGETLTLTTIGASLPGLTITPGQFTTRTNRDTLSATVCFGRCAGGPTGRVTLRMVVSDSGCPQALQDTLTVQLNIIPDPNQKPLVTTDLPNQSQVIDLNIVPGDTVASSIRFNVSGDDADRDSLRLYAIGRGFDYAKLGMRFATQNGRPVLQSPFDWAVTCDLLQGKSEATFTIDFIADDGKCPLNRADTTTVTVNVKSLPADYDITIPNVFTPNNDGFNDYFAARNLPPDNCTEEFRLVEIVNRWGRRVFSSTDRNFRWYGENYPAGEYLYAIQYTRRQYKGHLTLLR
ncbi:MAG: gliding motility-associated C-terminal domain-containing protein, partial [Bacteroidetes bacterium]|nr:gliding motility-associated C-terminal domain-containing protein [Fibrella sp.]